MSKRTRKLYYSDNLPILREMEDESVDLIYLDPPFNSKKVYNIIYPDDDAQAAAFSDVWAWGTQEDTYLKEIAQLHIKAIDVIQALVEGLGKIQLCAYLVNMTVRLVELHRILKPTGSLYLHCDPTASHYLKIVMDGIFGYSNFRNELVWHYQAGTKGSKQFGKKHDVILFYSKSKNSYFLRQKKPVVNPKRYNKKDEDGRLYDVNGQGRRYYLDDGQSCDDVWTYVQEKQYQQINSQSKEKLGYPTQKPLALLDRIIKASSHKGDLVLDPFCGCGTTVAAAENNDRNWIGIDITYSSVAAIQERFKRTRVDIWDDIEVIGKPKTQKDLNDLLKKAQSSLYVRKEFEKFCVTQVGGLPNDKMGADGGIDGQIMLSTQQKAVVSVKSGRVNVEQIRALKGVLDGKKYVAGVFLTRNAPTKDMIQFADSAGLHNSLERSSFSFEDPFPVLQILTLKDVLEGTRPDLPYMHAVR